nr:MAG TPA: hypothetical protein [Caudoviricetes sp.]
MKILNPHEIYELSTKLRISFEDAEAVSELFYNFAYLKKIKYFSNLTEDNLNSVSDYENIYNMLNCTIHGSFEDVIKYAVEHDGYKLTFYHYYQKATEFILNEYNKSIFKMSNGDYLRIHKINIKTRGDAKMITKENNTNNQLPEDVLYNNKTDFEKWLMFDRELRSLQPNCSFPDTNIINYENTLISLFAIIMNKQYFGNNEVTKMYLENAKQDFYSFIEIYSKQYKKNFKFMKKFAEEFIFNMED